MTSREVKQNMMIGLISNHFSRTDVAMQAEELIAKWALSCSGSRRTGLEILKMLSLAGYIILKDIGSKKEPKLLITAYRGKK